MQKTQVNKHRGVAGGKTRQLFLTSASNGCKMLYICLCDFNKGHFVKHLSLFVPLTQHVVCETMGE